MNNQDLVNYLAECGVCKVCQLRYLKSRGNEYQDMKKTFKNLNVEYHENDDVSATKKQKPNVCPTCLGLFSNEFQDKLLEAISSEGIEKHECDSVFVAISMPILLQIRQLSMWYGLLRKFSYMSNEKAPDVPLKEAAKLIINPIICEKLNKKYDINGIMISINLMHIQEKDEVTNIEKLNEQVFPTKGGKRQEISRSIVKNYNPLRVSEELYTKYLTVPPTIPNDCLSLVSVSVVGPTVFVAGRYRKLTRFLSHTPWMLNGKRVMEDSVEEIIVRTIAPHFCNDQSKVIFMSSGREDVDVRCLGRGRPFVLEIPNALRIKLTKKEAFAMEQESNKSLQISICDIQVVKREDTVHIKTGEEKKRKFYRALCKLNEPATVEILEKLNLIEGFEIQQKTPLRVLHRRPLLTRPRTIHSLKAFVDRKNSRALILDIITQAGTYIKELVHGDFGRTSPSICSLIGQPVDILALDVVGIDLDWPPKVDNSV